MRIELPHCVPRTVEVEYQTGERQFICLAWGINCSKWWLYPQEPDETQVFHLGPHRDGGCPRPNLAVVPFRDHEKRGPWFSGANSNSVRAHIGDRNIGSRYCFRCHVPISTRVSSVQRRSRSRRERGRRVTRRVTS